MLPHRALVDAVVLTALHSFSGKLHLGSRRLSEFLNDRRETVIGLEEAVITRLGDQPRVIGRHPEAALLKSSAVLAFEAQQSTSQTPDRLYRYIRKDAHQVLIVIEGIEICGFFHTVGDLELHRAMANPLQDFVPITQPTITIQSGTRLVLKPQAVMVNLHRISCIARAHTTAAQPRQSDQEQ